MYFQIKSLNTCWDFNLVILWFGSEGTVLPSKGNACWFKLDENFMFRGILVWKEKKDPVYLKYSIRDNRFI